MGRVVLLRCVTTISCSSQFIARPAKQCLRVCPHHTAITRKCLHALSAPNHGQSQQTNTPTLSYLDLVLGSKDDEKVAVEVESGQDAADTTVLRVPSWAWRELREPRVVPIASNVLYYLLLLVYTSYYTVQLAQGQEVADDILARLVNDHAAVASGDTLRLFTSFFVANSIPQLIIGLLSLATLAAELESLLGYSTFWALWCVTVVTGSFADAASSNIPITSGPAAGVAGIAAALLAHHLHNWRIEQVVAQSKTADSVPGSLQLLVQQYNDQQQQLESAATTAAGAEQALGDQPQQQHLLRTLTAEAILEDDELVETKVDGPVGLSLKLLVPREGQAFVTLGGTAVTIVSALKEAVDTDIATDWTALAAGFAAGGLLGWFTCPVYRLSLMPASSTKAKDILDVSSAEDADLLLPVLVDSRPLVERVNVMVGYVAVLYAAIGAWLVTQ